MKLLKTVLHPRIKLFLLLTILFSMFIFVSAYSYVTAVSNDIADSVFRLHVIANSDSSEDQALKYMVRDALLDYMNQLAQNTSSKQEVIKLAQTHLLELEQIAKNTILEKGYSYDVHVTIGNFSFPTKEYGDITLPAGYYDALRVEIGEASGQNWWCVMFPPLCFVDVSSGIVPEESKEEMRNNLSEEEYSLISNDSNQEIRFKFKLIEFLQNTKILTAKN